MGVRSDYLSPVLYLTDIFWIILVIFNFKTPQSLGKSGHPPAEAIASAIAGRSPLEKREPLKKNKYLAFLIFIIVNIAVASSPMVAIYRWLRIGQLLISIVWIRKNQEKIKNYLIKIIPIWLVGESLLAVAQMANNGSLNGIFYWLGERNFTFNTVGIAQMSVLGRGLIRSYGTFSHPNSLAGFLLVSLVLWNWMKPTLPSLKKGGLYLILEWVVVWMSIVGIVLTGSRTIWVLGVGVGIYYLYKTLPPRYTRGPPLTGRLLNIDLILILGLFLGLLGTILTLLNRDYWLKDFWGGWDKESWSKRLELMKISWEMIKKSPIWGIGAGNFVVELGKIGKTTWLQPVHNIFLLVANELGLLGILGIIFSLTAGRQAFKNKNLLLLIIIGLSGMVDHYWVTLMQNNWLLVLVFGLI